MMTHLPELQVFSFHLENDPDKLVCIFSIPGAAEENAASIKAHIGKFRGRSGFTYAASDLKKRIFALVLEGAFEVQNMLLECRDALAIWNAKEIEGEALSNNAIVLLLELPEF